MFCGVFLPKDMWEKLYCKNAERLLVGLKKPDAGATSKSSGA